MQRIRFSRSIEGYIEPMKLSSRVPQEPWTARRLIAHVTLDMECGALASLSPGRALHPDAHQQIKLVHRKWSHASRADRACASSMAASSGPMDHVAKLARLALRALADRRGPAAHFAA